MARYEYSGITDQAKAALRRHADARVLAEQEHWRGAMYMAGYAVECRLKRRLMEMHRARSLSELETILAKRHKGKKVDLATHSIEYLFGFTEATARLEGHSHRDVLHAYRRCNTWKTSWRYNPREGTRDECERFLNAVDVFTRFVETSI